MEKLDEEKLRAAIRAAITRPHWLVKDQRNQISASVDDLTTDVLHEVLEALSPPKETVTWMVGKEVRLAWPERKVMASRLDNASPPDAVEMAESILGRAREKGVDLLIIDLRPEKP